MFIAFIPRSLARAVLRDEDRAQEARNEMEADLGSSIFFGGASSWDAMEEARARLDDQWLEYLETPEGQLHYAQLEAARFMYEAITPDMHIVDHTDSDGFAFQPWGAIPVPEYYPEPSDDVLAMDELFRLPAPTDDCLPF